METNNNIKGFNIAEALKDAPKGLKLYTPLFGEVRFIKIFQDTILANTLRDIDATFFQDGRYYNYNNTECLLFPSVNHRCWNHWQNTLFPESIGSVCVDTITGNKFILGEDGTYFSDNTGSLYSTLIEGEDSGNYLLNSRYATPEEAKEFFEELNKNGYKWNGKMVVKSTSQPKFKVGDWIVNNEDGSIGQITDIIYDESGYGYNHTNGWLHSVFEKDFHLWTIQDAKDGDVLACGDKVTDCPFIFHNLTKELNPRSYCGVNTLHHFQDNDENGGFWCYSDEVRPATKEQRDFLFQKMKEEGYKWDVDAKKLIKTTTPIPKFKVGDIIRNEPTGVFMAIKEIKDDSYITTDGTMLLFKYQDRWELAGKANLSLEAKVSVLADEIIALKQRIKALEIQVIKDMSTPPLTQVYSCPDKAGDCVTLKDMKS